MKFIHKIMASLLTMALPVVASAQVSLTADNFKIDAGGEATFAVNMLNEGQQISDAQFDMAMPAGLTFKDATLVANRSNGHSLTISAVEGKTRIFIMGTTNNFKDNQGAIVNVTVKASDTFETGKIGFSFVRFSDLNGNPFKGDNFDIEANPPVPETLEGVQIFADNVTIGTDGLGTLPINLDNPQYSVTAAQFELTLPTGVKVSNVVGTDRAANLTTSFKELNNGKVRVVMADLTAQLKTISGTEGAICNVTLELTDNYFTSGKVTIDQILMSNPANLKYTPTAFDVTVTNSAAGIESASVNEMLKGNVYNLQGVKVLENATSLEGLSKGVYILNGKKIVKN
jgi:hypothetical protein